VQLVPPNPVDGADRERFAPARSTTDGAFEVMYLIETSDAAAAALRLHLDAIGASVVVVGGDGLWNVHVHLDDAGSAVEAGVAAGRVFGIRITPLVEVGPTQRRSHPDRPARLVVAAASGAGTASLFEAAGASVVLAGPGERPTPADLVSAALDAVEVLLLPNDPDHLASAETAADLLRGHGVQVVILPTRAEVQGLAALAVHDAHRDLTDDVVTMSAAAAGTQYAALTRAEREAMTSAGICRAGQVLGLIDGDVAVIGDSAEEVALAVVQRMVSTGGELVTLLCADDPFAGRPLADAIRRHLHLTRLDLEVVVYDGGQSHYPLQIGVE
jgi:dihydroxyacetone kinase-like predicted kinase